MKTLQHLLFPCPVAQFFRQNWTQQAVHIAAKNPQKFGALFSWQALNHLLNFQLLAYPDLRFNLDGRALPDADRCDWRDRLQQGATLVIDRIHEQVPEVAALAASIRNETGYHTQVNLYCSPAEQQGFDCHYDTHDVLILQIDGEKEWTVFRETIPFPTVESRTEDQLPPDEPPYLKCALKPGDVLYIPRGHWHYAIACDRPSLHLTLGIDCHTGLDWLRWLVGELQSQPEWRENLPPIFHEDTQALQQHLKTLSQRLSNQLEQPEFISKYTHYLIRQKRPTAPISLPFQLGFDIFRDGLETRFVCPSEQRLVIESLNDHDYQITTDSKQIILKNVTAHLIAHLFDHHSFNLFEMAEWAPDLDLEMEVVPLLTQLVTAGVLFVEEAVRMRDEG